MSKTPRSYDEICLDKSASPLERETALLREWKDTLIKARTLETQRDEARAEVERLHAIIKKRSQFAEFHVRKAAEAEAEVERLSKLIPVYKQMDWPDSAIQGLPTSPEIFEAHGREWYRHTPGDKMPCDGEMIVCAILGDEIKDDTPAYILKLSRPAKDWDWSEDSNDLIGWRPADATEKLPR